MTCNTSMFANKKRLLNVFISTNLLLSINFTSFRAYGNNYLAANKATSRINGCWVKKKIGNLNPEDFSSATICFSRNGSVHGAFIERNGLGSEETGEWSIRDKYKVQIMNKKCSYYFKSSLILVINKCSYSGNWSKNS
jgi:hypothetical protein